jgi:hypothetical protein
VKHYLSTDYTRSPRTRAVQSDWHEIILSIARVSRVFKENGDTRESDQLYAYAETFIQHAHRHLERIANSNGHHKDSATVVSELPAQSTPLEALEDATVNGLAPTDETGAVEGGGRSQSIPPDADATAATPISGVVPRHFDLTLVERCELRIQQVAALLRSSDDQRLEVGMTFLTRVRDLARRNHPTADARFAAAEVVLRGEQETGT